MTKTTNSQAGRHNNCKLDMRLVLNLLCCCLFFSSSLVADEKPNRISVATWNTEWFYDAYTGNNSSDLSKKQSAPSPEEWQWKLENVARVIAEMEPTILALQEIENRQVIRQLTKFLADRYKLRYRIAYIEGWDNFTEQDVAVIYQSGLVRYSCREQTVDMFKSKEFYNLNKHLFADFEWGEGDAKEKLSLLTVHLRAMPEKHELRQKQCRLIRAWLQEQLTAGENIIVLGDLNTEELADAINPGSDLALLSGWDTEDKSDDLVDLHSFLPAESRDSHIGGRQFDRILVSQSMLDNKKRAKDLSFARIANFKKLVVVKGLDDNHFDGFYDIPRNQRDISDHYPIMAEFQFK